MLVIVSSTVSNLAKSGKTDLIPATDMQLCGINYTQTAEYGLMYADRLLALLIQQHRVALIVRGNDRIKHAGLCYSFDTTMHTVLHQ